MSALSNFGAMAKTRSRANQVPCMYPCVCMYIYIYIYMYIKHTYKHTNRFVVGKGNTHSVGVWRNINLQTREKIAKIEIYEQLVYTCSKKQG